MRRNTLYIPAFIILASAAVILLATNRKSSIRQRNMNFALEEPSLVDRIVISDATGRLMMEKDGDRWRINEKYTARTVTVNQFLQALGRIEVLSPASKSILDTLTRTIGERGTLVNLYQGNRSLSSFRVYFEKELIPGTYMMDERFRKPFRVGLTGYQGDNFAGLFNSDINQWRDKLLLDFRPGEIASVCMEYHSAPDQSFIITAAPGQPPRLDPLVSKKVPGQPPGIDPLVSKYVPGQPPGLDPPVSKNVPALIDPQEIADYLAYFSDVHYVKQAASADGSRTLTELFATLTLTDRSQQVFRMKAYRIPGTGSTDYDINRYYAVIDGDSLPLIVKYSETDPIMRPLSDFLKK